MLSNSIDSFAGRNLVWISDRELHSFEASACPRISRRHVRLQDFHVSRVSCPRDERVSAPSTSSVTQSNKSQKKRFPAPMIGWMLAVQSVFVSTLSSHRSASVSPTFSISTSNGSPKIVLLDLILSSNPKYMNTNEPQACSSSDWRHIPDGTLSSPVALPLTPLNKQFEPTSTSPSTTKIECSITVPLPTVTLPVAVKHEFIITLEWATCVAGMMYVPSRRTSPRSFPNCWQRFSKWFAGGAVLQPCTRRSTNSRVVPRWRNWPAGTVIALRRNLCNARWMECRTSGGSSSPKALWN
mmetsp:Transcript_39328/g.58411  ORF Transcript_39328/g.58411 Transcript_39328/m.58411 type:complete len:297 (+) Transcript_39328:912-1802(+)